MVTKYKINIDRKVLETEIQFLNYHNLRELFLQRGSITEEDKWVFYMFTNGIESDIKIDLKFVLDLNQCFYKPRFYSVGNTIFGC